MCVLVCVFALFELTDREAEGERGTEADAQAEAEAEARGDRDGDRDSGASGRCGCGRAERGKETEEGVTAETEISL